MKLLQLFALFAVVTAVIKTTKKPMITTTTTVSPRYYDYDISLFGLYRSDLYKIYTFTTMIYIAVCALCFLLNFVQLFLLGCKKSHPVFTILLWICFSDIIQCLASLAMFITDLFAPKVSGCGYPYNYAMAWKVIETIKIFCTKFSSLLILFLAAYGVFSVKPITMTLSMVLIGLVSAMWSIAYFAQLYVGLLPNCSGAYYWPLFGQRWELQYRLIDGYMAFGICAFMALIGFAACCKSENTTGKYGHPIKSSTLITLICVFTFLFQMIYGVLGYIDNSIFPGYLEKSYFQLETVMQIGLLLNSILKCFFYFCVSTKVKSTQELVPVRPMPVAVPKPATPVTMSAPVAPTAPVAPANPTPIAPMTQPAPTPMVMPQPQQLISQGVPSNTQAMVPLGFQATPGTMMIPNVIPNMVPNMMIPNVVPAGNGQGNMQVSVVVLPMPYYSPNQ